jgi:hypothetical protein
MAVSKEQQHFLQKYQRIGVFIIADVTMMHGTNISGVQNFACLATRATLRVTLPRVPAVKGHQLAPGSTISIRTVADTT